MKFKGNKINKNKNQPQNKYKNKHNNNKNSVNNKMIVLDKSALVNKKIK